jgi:hypothetical protein
MASRNCSILRIQPLSGSVSTDGLALDGVPTRYPFSTNGTPSLQRMPSPLMAWPRWHAIASRHLSIGCLSIGCLSIGCLLLYGMPRFAWLSSPLV